MGKIEQVVQAFQDAYRSWSAETGVRLTDSQQYWVFVKKLDLYHRTGFFVSINMN